MVVERLNTGMLITRNESLRGNEQFTKDPRAEEESKGTIPIGLGTVRLIPTGSVFIPRELIVPSEPKQNNVTQDVIPPVMSTQPLKPPEGLNKVNISNTIIKPEQVQGVEQISTVEGGSNLLDVMG